LFFLDPHCYESVGFILIDPIRIFEECALLGGETYKGSGQTVLFAVPVENGGFGWGGIAA
jgi:hypothetical protein